MSLVPIPLFEGGYVQTAAEQSALQLNFAEAVAGLQLVQHCDKGSSGLLPPDHPYFPTHKYDIYPYYPNKRDETGAGWAAGRLSVGDLLSHQIVLEVRIFGTPAPHGPHVKIEGKDLPEDVDVKVASVLDIFARGSNQFLRANPLVAKGLERVNAAHFIGKDRRKAIRHLNALVSKAVNG